MTCDVTLVCVQVRIVILINEPALPAGRKRSLFAERTTFSTNYGVACVFFNSSSNNATKHVKIYLTLNLIAHLKIGYTNTNHLYQSKDQYFKFMNLRWWSIW